MKEREAGQIKLRKSFFDGYLTTNRPDSERYREEGVERLREVVETRF